MGLIACFILMITSCTKDDQPTPPDLYGSWVVLQTDSEGLQFHVELRFNMDNSYDWILLDHVPAHSNSHADFEQEGNIIHIVSDPDCEGIGRYYVTVNSNKLALIAQQDDCAPRAAALEYIWQKKSGKK